jgi:hypothetical protein
MPALSRALSRATTIALMVAGVAYIVPGAASNLLIVGSDASERSLKVLCFHRSIARAALGCSVVRVLSCSVVSMNRPYQFDWPHSRAST